MPYGVSGVEKKMAFKKGSAWGTAVACGSGDGVLILPHGIKKDAPVDIDDSLGLYFSKDGQLGPIKVEGPVPAYLRYDSLDVLIAMFMGIAGAPVQQGASAAYAFAYVLDMDTDGMIVTAAEHMKNYISEIPSLKIIGMTIKGEVGKPVQIIFDTIGINKIQDSVVNTLVTYTNVTYTEQQNRIKYSEGVYRLNDQSAAALDVANKIYPASFELTAKRTLKGIYDGQYKYINGLNVQDLVDEPTNDGLIDCKLKLTFPRHAATTYLAALGADTRKKMDMTFTGALIGATYYRTFLLQFPHLQLINDDPADEKGIISEPLEFAALGAVSAPLGMTGITQPFKISGINQRTTDPLG